MADPLTDAYEREIQRRTAPLTKGQQISQGIADLLPPAGISPFQYYPMLAAEKMASGVTDYLESPSDLVERRSIRSHKRKRSAVSWR